jgi:hypothetical protein
MVTKCGENQSRVRLSLGLLVLTIILVWVVTGCSGKTPTPVAAVQPPVISEPKVGAPTPLNPGEEAGISVDVSKATGVTLTYTWIVDGGEIVRGQESPAITYCAPEEPGTYNVRVVVGWDDQSVERAISIKVEEEPTPTPTSPPPTETPTPAAIDTPVPADTPASTDTPTPTAPPPPPLTPEPTTPSAPPPTPKCEESFRPRLTGVADFAGDVEIKTPTNCTTGLSTETIIPVAGTYEGIPADVEIWVFTYPPNLVYYVQSPNACEGAKMSWGDGKWQVPIYLGEKGGGPEWFDIVVVLTDQEAGQFLSDWVRQCCQQRSYQGIPAAQLEQMNITEKNYITVQTQD